VPRELTGSEIEDIIDRFATAAEVCEAACFDGVQIHAAHGYLVTQFLSPLSNLRDDEWGGDPTRRMRFLIEVVRRVRSRVSPGFAVSVKLNSADFQRGGFSEDDSRDVVAALAKEAVDLIEVSGGNYESPAMSGSAASSTRAREAYFLDYARSVRDAAGSVPLAVTGGFRTRSGMQDALTAGDCDVIGIARPTVTTTDAAQAILRGRVATLTTHEIAVGMRGLIGRVADLKTLDGVLNLGWSEDQMHRIAKGKEPDLDRGALRTVLALLRRNGRVSVKRRRSLS
jgi:2,4-dienoyl-CoA reductase-like NADH-dependent reductase (Old Yellow Enzyme family)